MAIVASAAGLAACTPSTPSPPPAAGSAQSIQRTTSRAAPQSAVVAPATTSSRPLRSTFAQTVSVEISVSRATHSSTKQVAAVHRTVTGVAASSVAHVADSLLVLARAPDCMGYAPVNLRDTLVFRDATGRILGTVEVGGCPTPIAYLHTASDSVALIPGSGVDAAALVALGLPASYGLVHS
jgi:hypothetical protein